MSLLHFKDTSSTNVSGRPKASFQSVGGSPVELQILGLKALDFCLQVIQHQKSSLDSYPKRKIMEHHFADLSTDTCSCFRTLRNKKIYKTLFISHQAHVRGYRRRAERASAKVSWQLQF